MTDKPRIRLYGSDQCPYCVAARMLLTKKGLQFEEVPVGGHCRDCVSEFTVEEKFVFACPKCGGVEFTMSSGHELEVVDLEVDE